MRGVINIVDPYEVYIKYLALKSHFSDLNYDYFKYNGKVKAWRSTFDTRKDKYFFYKLSKKKDPIEYLVANFIGSNDFYIGNIRADESDQIYMDYKKRKESLSYVFKSDLSKMKENFNDNIVVPNNEHPYLLRLYMRGDISLETLTLINKCVNIFDYWDKELKDDIMWPDLKLERIISLYLFISTDIKGSYFTAFNFISGHIISSFSSLSQ